MAANFDEEDLKRLLKQANNPEVAKVAQEQLDIIKQNKEAAKEAARETTKTTKEVSDLKKEQKKTNDALKELVGLTKEQIKLQKQATNTQTTTKPTKQTVDYGQPQGPDRPLIEEIKGLVKEIKIAAKNDVKKKDGFGSEDPEIVKELKELTKSITESVGGSVRNLGNDIFKNAFPGLSGMVKEEKPKPAGKSSDSSPKGENMTLGLSKVEARLEEAAEKIDTSNQTLNSMLNQQMETNKLLNMLLKNSSKGSAPTSDNNGGRGIELGDILDMAKKGGRAVGRGAGAIARGAGTLGQSALSFLGTTAGAATAAGAGFGAMGYGVMKGIEGTGKTEEGAKQTNDNMMGGLDPSGMNVPIGRVAQPEPSAQKPLVRPKIERLNTNLKDEELVKYFAEKMGIDVSKQYTAETRGNVPVSINGIPVPRELYTEEQANSVDAAIKMAAMMSGKTPAIPNGGASEKPEKTETPAINTVKKDPILAGEHANIDKKIKEDQDMAAGVKKPDPNDAYYAKQAAKPSVTGSSSKMTKEEWNDIETRDAKEEAELTNKADKVRRAAGAGETGKVSGALQGGEVVSAKKDTDTVTTDTSSDIMAERQAAVQRKEENDAAAEKQKKQRELSFEADTIILKSDKIIFTSTPTAQAGGAPSKGAAAPAGQEVGSPSPVAPTTTQSGAGNGGGTPAAPAPTSGAAVAMQKADAVKQSVAQSGAAASGVGGGAPAIGGASKGVGGPVAKPNLVNVKTASGKNVQVAGAYAKNFQGFINDLEATGYKINSIGGYADRANVNNPGVKSYHASGAAIDINPGANPNKSTKTDLPAETGALAAKWGLGWGMNWKSVKDPMHFSAAKGEQGSFDIPRNGGIAAGEVEGGAASGGGGDQGGKKEDKSKDPVGGSGGGAAPTPPPAKKEEGGAMGGSGAPASPPPAAAPAPATPDAGAKLAAASSNDISSQRSSGSGMRSEAASGGDSGGAPASGQEGNARFDKDNVGNVEPADAAKRLKDLFGMAA